MDLLLLVTLLCGNSSLAHACSVRSVWVWVRTRIHAAGRMTKALSESVSQPPFGQTNLPAQNTLFWLCAPIHSSRFSVTRLFTPCWPLEIWAADSVTAVSCITGPLHSHFPPSSCSATVSRFDACFYAVCGCFRGFLEHRRSGPGKLGVSHLASRVMYQIARSLVAGMCSAIGIERKES